MTVFSVVQLLRGVSWASAAGHSSTGEVNVYSESKRDNKSAGQEAAGRRSNAAQS